MEVFVFFLTYFLLLLASAILLCGFYAITRGYKETTPSGEIKYKGKIFKGYYFFWMAEKSEMEKVYYLGDHLAYIVKSIKNYVGLCPIQLLNHTKIDKNILVELNAQRFFTSDLSFFDQIPTLRYNLGIDFDVTLLGDGRINVYVYKNEPVYVYPWWVRDMMVGCITCFSSFYGTIIFLLSNLFFGHFFSYTLYIIIPDGYGCVYFLNIFMIWVAYCISLSWLNTVLWKKFN